MSAKFKLSDPAFVTQLMPAIRRLHLRPLESIKHVSFVTGVELAHLEAWVEAHGRSESGVADAETILGGETEETENARTQERETAEENKAPKVAVTVAPDVVTAPVIRRASRMADYIQVCKILLGGDSISEGKACAMADVKQGSWSYFKLHQFGEGMPSKEALSAFLVRQGVPGAVVVEAANTVREAVSARNDAEPKPKAPEIERKGPPAERKGARTRKDETSAVDVVVARFRAELERLQKQAAGVERAMIVAEAKVEAAAEILAAMEGGAS